SVGSTGVVALKGCLPLAEAVSRGADSAVIHKVLPDQIGKVDVDSVIESPRHLSLRQLKLSTPELLPVRYLLITEANDLQGW
nr:hypothetical protein [Tanacetum cinerariifolium]